MFVKQFLRPFRARQAKRKWFGGKQKTMEFVRCQKELVISLTGIVTPFSIQNRLQHLSMEYRTLYNRFVLQIISNKKNCTIFGDCSNPSVRAGIINWFMILFIAKFWPFHPYLSRLKKTVSFTCIFLSLSLLCIQSLVFGVKSHVSFFSIFSPHLRLKKNNMRRLHCQRTVSIALSAFQWTVPIRRAMIRSTTTTRRRSWSHRAWAAARAGMGCFRPRPASKLPAIMVSIIALVRFFLLYFLY